MSMLENINTAVNVDSTGAGARACIALLTAGSDFHMQLSFIHTITNGRTLRVRWEASLQIVNEAFDDEFRGTASTTDVTARTHRTSV